MNVSQADLGRVLDQLILAGRESLRARDPALADLLDTAPPSAPIAPRPVVAGPMFATGPLARVKVLLLRVRVLRPALEYARAILIRSSGWRGS